MCWRSTLCLSMSTTTNCRIAEQGLSSRSDRQHRICYVTKSRPYDKLLLILYITYGFIHGVIYNIKTLYTVITITVNNLLTVIRFVLDWWVFTFSFILKTNSNDVSIQPSVLPYIGSVHDSGWVFTTKSLSIQPDPQRYYELCVLREVCNTKSTVRGRQDEGKDWPIPHPDIQNFLLTSSSISYRKYVECVGGERKRTRGSVRGDKKNRVKGKSRKEKFMTKQITEVNSGWQKIHKINVYLFIDTITQSRRRVRVEETTKDPGRNEVLKKRWKLRWEFENNLSKYTVNDFGLF